MVGLSSIILTSIREAIMFDQQISYKLRPIFVKIATYLQKFHINADCITGIGFLVGILSLPLLIMECYISALVAMLLNRLLDGVDGELARQNKVTGAGGFLDITFDFIFYGLFVLGFAIVNPNHNAVIVSVLLFTFICASSSFLAFAMMVEKYAISDFKTLGKSFYYLDKGVEGGETIVFFILSCLFPSYFWLFGIVFSGLCFLTSIQRIWYGYWSIKQAESLKVNI